MPKCECGCGQVVVRRFVKGHNRRTDALARLMSKRRVDAGPLDTPCWIFTGALFQESGYGQFWLGGTSSSAHVAAWLLMRGPIPKGKELDHLCRVRACFNPDHLEPVTHVVNIRRSPIIGRRTSTHCKKGHAFAKHGRRAVDKQGRERWFCRPCTNGNSREYRKRQRLAR